MNCLKCGLLFSEEEVLMIIEDGEDPICDTCITNGDIYLFTYGDKEFAVQANDEKEALENWESYVKWMGFAQPNENPIIRKVEYFVAID